MNKEDDQFLYATKNIEKVTDRLTVKEIEEKYEFSKPISDFFKGDSFPFIGLKLPKVKNQ